eukprot:m.47985 g.47985  ORF g.47985 m.47985 type:complete len:202 (-) comp14913_c0_seq1:127-732(-)
MSNPAQRNLPHILERMQKFIPVATKGKGLEIASGSGLHIAALANVFKEMVWQPSDVEEGSLEGIREKCETAVNVLAPVLLDAANLPEQWNIAAEPHSLRVLLNINMIHISPFAATEGLFRGAGHYLQPGGLLCTYGPYRVDGVLAPQSNVDFDAYLKSRNAAWGVRDVVRDLAPLAQQHGLTLLAVEEMPANNKMLFFQKN